MREHLLSCFEQHYISAFDLCNVSRTVLLLIIAIIIVVIIEIIT